MTKLNKTKKLPGSNTEGSKRGKWKGRANKGGVSPARVWGRRGRAVFNNTGLNKV